MQMKITRIEFIPAGKRELLTDPDIMAVVKGSASELAGKLGDGYETDSRLGRFRGNASVFTADPERIAENLEDNTVLRVLGGMLHD